MIKSILLLLKYGSLTLINDIIFIFRRLTEVLMSGFDNLDYNIFLSIRLLRFDKFCSRPRRLSLQNDCVARDGLAVG